MLASAAQVKPFILRRTKDKVLSDLPPKILQDVYIDPSPLQRLLYQDFASSDASHQVQGALKSEGPSEAVADKAPHVFQVSLQQLPGFRVMLTCFKFDRPKSCSSQNCSALAFLV